MFKKELKRSNNQVYVFKCFLLMEATQYNESALIFTVTLTVIQCALQRAILLLYCFDELKQLLTSLGKCIRNTLNR